MSYIENIESSELSTFFDIVRNSNASMAKLVDASDLKSDILMVCRFESGYSHQTLDLLRYHCDLRFETMTVDVV